MTGSTAIMNAEGLATHAKFNWTLLKTHPLKGTGIGFILLLRILMGLFFAGGAVNKFQRDYLFSDYPLQLFTKRLSELDPASLPGQYLEGFLIPNYQLVGWTVAWGETAVAVGLLLGFMTRLSGIGAIFIMVNFAIGGYYDASLIPLNLITLLFVVFPTGHWLGVDRRLAQRYPNNILFK